MSFLNEKQVELKLVTETRKKGGLAVKFVSLQVVPFPEFFRPSISRYSEGGHDQNPVDFKGVIHQIPNSRQGRHRLAAPKPISSRRAVTGWVLMYSMA